RRAEEDGGVGQLHVRGTAIRLRKHGNTADAKLAARPNHAAGDFAAVRDQDSRQSHAPSITTRTSSSCTTSPAPTRTSATVPSTSDVIGISIFMDSRTTTSSPARTWSPGWTRMSRIVPAMCAMISIGDFARRYGMVPEHSLDSFEEDAEG